MRDMQKQIILEHVSDISPYIMFLNDDVELQPGAIKSVIDTFQDGTIGVVGIKLLFPPTSASPIVPQGRYNTLEWL